MFLKLSHIFYTHISVHKREFVHLQLNKAKMQYLNGHNRPRASDGDLLLSPTFPNSVLPMALF
jgi:hypothetical protein